MALARGRRAHHRACARALRRPAVGLSARAAHVFGYGSLVARAGAVPCALRGWRRRWGVAMDNTVDLPGYKHYLDPWTGERPALCVCFLDIEPAPPTVRPEAVAGAAFAVDARELAALDRRERNYARVEVGAALDAALDGPVYAYVGRADARARRDRAARAGRLVVDRAYHDAVAAALGAIGAAAPPPPCPVRALCVVRG